MLNNYINTYSLQGRRERNEDQHFNLLNINNKNKKIEILFYYDVILFNY